MADIDEGVYEIRSMLAPNSWALDAEGARFANRTNAEIWEPLHNTAQTWILTKASDGVYYIRPKAAQGYALDADGGVFADRTNVQLWEYIQSDAQKWQVMDANETATVDGVGCAVAYILANGGNAVDGTVYALDKEAGEDDLGNRNVWLYHFNRTAAQKWALLPSEGGIDKNLASPIAMTLSRVQSSGASAAAPTPLTCASYYPRWYRIPTTATVYTRVRHRSFKDGSWGAWTSFPAYAETAVINKGQNVVAKKPVDMSFEFSDGTKREYQVETMYTKDGSRSPSSMQTYTVYKKPGTALSAATYTRKGLKLEFTKSYTGNVYYKLRTATGADVSGLDVLNDSEGHILIPSSKLTSILADGGTFSLSWYEATDEGALLPNVKTGKVAAAQLQPKDVTPTITAGKGVTLTATVAYANTVRMWLIVGSDKTELTGTVSGGKTAFQVAYPFGKAYQLYTTYEQSDGDDWGYSTLSMPATSQRIHAWDWDGGALALWLDTDLVKESRDYSLFTDTHTLAGRSKPAVSILSDSNGDSYMEISGSVTGVLLPDDKYNCTVDDVEALLKVGHARYRSPNGRIAQVAVTGANVETNHVYSSVSIDQVEVG